MKDITVAELCGAEEELREMHDSLVWYRNRFNAVERDNRIYKSRIDKAIEYIDNSDILDIHHKNRHDLLNILRGEDK